MKIIFLDIDGVLSLAGDSFKRAAVTTDITVPYLWNNEACSRFNELLQDTEANIVLSSDWRKHYRLQDMKVILDYNGVMGDRLIGYTPINPKYRYSGTTQAAGIYRSAEINDWLKLHGVKRWIAIDDMPLSAIDKDRFIHCKDTHKGILVDGMLELAKAKLNE